MRFSVLFTEKKGKNEEEIVYVSPTDSKEILRLNSSLKPYKSVGANLKNVLKEVFLPQGYPDSVSSDYTAYQIWDTIQACCSTITNTLATRSVLKGLGVGDGAADALSAAVAWVMKDGTGMLAKILFAWGVGPGLDAECKKWRLFADILNDISISIELHLLPRYTDYSLHLLCLSTSIKAVVGVSGGSTRAAITQHQAIRHNTADVSAKDGSQETCVNLITSFLGLAILSALGDSNAINYIFLGFTILHIYANYKAVKSLNFNIFNEERLALTIYEHLIHERVHKPQEINNKESVILFLGFHDKSLCGYSIKIGHSFEKFIKNNKVTPNQLRLCTNIYLGRKYMLLLAEKDSYIYIALDEEHKNGDVLLGYFHAVLLGIALCYLQGKNLKIIEIAELTPQNTIISQLLETVLPRRAEYLRKGVDVSILLAVDELASQSAGPFLSKCSKIGWDISKHQIHIKDWRAKWNDKSAISNYDFIKDKAN